MTADTIRTLFERHAHLTIAQVAQIARLHPEVVRRHVKPPTYRRVDCEWATRGWQYRWRLVTEFCDCGAPAWFVGHARITPDRTYTAITFYLCHACAQDADTGIRVEPIG